MHCDDQFLTPPIQDALWNSIIGDEKTLTWYLNEAQSKAGEALQFVTEWLDKMKIQHSNPVAGHFIFVDLRNFLPKHDKDGKDLKTGQEQEGELFQRLLFKHSVYVAPGSFYHSQQAGFFRLTFTLKRDFMDVALQRIEECLLAVQKDNQVST